MKYGNPGLLDDVKNYAKTKTSYTLGFPIHPQIKTLETEASVFSPYTFYSRTNVVYVFYVYNDCLLCRKYEDPRLCMDLQGQNNYDEFVGTMGKTPSIFVDGNALKVEQELGSNIIMKHQYALSNFSEYRSITQQRVSAIEQHNGTVKVFYKTSDGAIRSAWEDGYTWVVDDMMHTLEN